MAENHNSHKEDSTTLAISLLAAVTIGAGVIHLGLVPNHASEWKLLGAGFAVVGWLQITLAVLAVARGNRAAAVAAVFVNLAAMGAYLWQSTSGFPFGPTKNVPESVDSLGLFAGALELASFLFLVATLAGVGSRASKRREPAAALASAVGLAAAIALVYAPAHDHGAEGHVHELAAGETITVDAMADTSRCDIGFNTAKFNDSTNPGVPVHDHGALTDTQRDELLRGFADTFWDPTGSGLSSRGGPDGIYNFLKANKPVADALLGGDVIHTISPDPWNPITDQAQCTRLGDELAEAKSIAETYPTVADAEAAGWTKVTNYVPAIAAHYMKFSYVDDKFNLAEPEMLLYDGTDQGSHIVGLSYYVLKDSDTEPSEGFVGDNDHYHRHIGLCIKDGVVAAGSNSTEDECAALGGKKNNGSTAWMSHVWIVPGCESDWGVFSGANPALKVGLDGESTNPGREGCGSGRSVTEPLTLDTRAPDNVASAREAAVKAGTLTLPTAGNAGDGHDHSHTARPVSAESDPLSDAGRCDVGFNTSKYNETALSGDTGHVHDQTPDQLEALLPEFAKTFYDPTDPGKYGQMGVDGITKLLSENSPLRTAILGGDVIHSLAPDNWIPITDQAECDKLTEQIKQAREVMLANPTVADAKKHGYFLVAPYLPGIASHFIKVGNIDSNFDPAQPEMLLYDGNDDSAHIVGISYYILGGDTEPTQGFAGDNDRYHRHLGLCMKGGVVVGGSGTTAEECKSLGGQKADGTAGWMSHLWIVPGCESDWGLFSGANPALKLGFDGRTGEPERIGCGTGLALDGSPRFDQSSAEELSQTRKAAINSGELSFGK